MKRSFKCISNLVRNGRLKSGITQIQLAEKLGFKNSQFISNIERAKSSIPEDSIKGLSRALNISKFDIIEAMTSDYRNTLMGK